ncbi:MAG: ArsR family transcriptional regulator [Nitrospirota bacterium]
MKKRPKAPAIPPERHETVRRAIMELLRDRTLSAKEISADVGIPEKAVYDHLTHIEKSALQKHRQLVVVPAACKKCGFVFRKRERLTKPGRCPVCKGQSIEEPLFSIEEKKNSEFRSQSERPFA